MTVYAIGDIHGQLDELRRAHDLIAADMRRRATPNAQIVHIGDYADRGPDVKGVLDFLIALTAENRHVVCLAGNHDRMMLGFLDADTSLDPRSDNFDWLSSDLGSAETLESYGVSSNWPTTRARFTKRVREAVPQAHIDFLRNLPLMHRTREHLFVHAGINPNRALDDQRDEDLLWIRTPFLHDTRDHGPLIVHGHTPVPDVEHAGNRVNIDTGAGFGRPLSAVAIERRKVYLLTKSGRVAVNPL